MTVCHHQAQGTGPLDQFCSVHWSTRRTAGVTIASAGGQIVVSHVPVHICLGLLIPLNGNKKRVFGQLAVMLLLTHGYSWQIDKNSSAWCSFNYQFSTGDRDCESGPLISRSYITVSIHLFTKPTQSIPKPAEPAVLMMLTSFRMLGLW